MSVSPDTSIELLVALVREGLDFYRDAQRRTADREAAAAFGVAAEIRALLLKDLQRIGVVADGTGEPPVRLEDALSYRAARERFDPLRPEGVAVELRKRETALMQLADALFKAHPRPGVRRVLKAYFPRLRHTAEMMRRLSHRAAA
jgi:hypothetical protein